MSAFRIYHNPRCSKSRQALAILEEAGIAPTIIRYLDTPPTAAEIAEIAQMLDLAPLALCRKKEDDFITYFREADSLSDDEICALLAAHPKVIERPLVIHGQKAVIGRPPEAVKALLPK